MTGKKYKDIGIEYLVVPLTATETGNCSAPPGNISDFDGFRSVAQTASVDVSRCRTALVRDLKA